MSISELAGKGIRSLFTTVKWLVGGIAALIFIVLAWSLIQESLILHSIQPGMTQAEVVAELGEPRLERYELGLCHDHTWLGDCKAAQLSGAVRYLIWKYGVDTYLVVGFDSDSRVVFRDIGDA